jgi:cytochrome c oxidase cbb3-type subunit 4
MSYDAMRHFADSWGLIFMGLVFLTFIGWTFRPNANRHHKDAANLIFDDSHEKGGNDDE